MNVSNRKWRRLNRWQVCQIDYPTVHRMNNWQLCLINSANSNATNDSNCAKPKRKKMQQPLANVPVWLSKTSWDQKWQLCQNQKQKSIATITSKYAWVTEQYQLQQPLASVPKQLSKNNQDFQQSSKTGTMCPPWKTANSYNWDAVGPSRDQMINCRSQKNRNPFSFLSKKATTSVNQQMCQSTNLILDKKGALLPFVLQQCTININQQMCRSTV